MNRRPEVMNGSTSKNEQLKNGEKNNHEDPCKMEEDDSDEEDEESTCGSGTTASRSGTPSSLPGQGRGGVRRKKKSFGVHRSKRKNWGSSSKYSKPLPKAKYSYSYHVKEDHAHPIFGCEFNYMLRNGEPLILATVGHNRVSVYECTNDFGLKLLMAFADPDAEEFYTCAWTADPQGKPLLAAGGARGIIRIFSTETATAIKHYVGHGQAINYIMFHPKDNNLMLSASKDHSLRLWNIKTDICVAIFGGVEGHRDEVLAADIDLNGFRMASCGMDHALKVWRLDKPKIQKTIQQSYLYGKNEKFSFPTLKVNFPDFSTRDIHRNYVDSVKWFGQFILSKSCEDQIICWKAGKIKNRWEDISMNSTETSVIHRFDIKDCDIWFIRFCLDFCKKTLAVGNKSGKTYIFDVNVSDPNQIRSSILTHPKCTSAIRQTALSRDGKVLICVCDDSTIWRWDRDEDFEDEVNTKS